MQLIITARDQVLARYGNAFASLGEGQARTAMSRALNHEGDKGRTRVKRALVKQIGIKYGEVDKAMATIRATPATLTYTLKARAPPDALIISGREGDAQVPQLPLRLRVEEVIWSADRASCRPPPRFGGHFCRALRDLRATLSSPTTPAAIVGIASKCQGGAGTRVAGGPGSRVAAGAVLPCRVFLVAGPDRRHRLMTPISVVIPTIC